jgi:aspartate aminotransferase
VLSKRIGSVPPSQTVALSDRVKAMREAGEDVVDLSVGEPDFSTPDPVKAAAEKALREGETTYGPSRGIPPLREAVVEDVRRERGLDIEDEQVLVTPSKHALFTAMLAILDPGDEVLAPSPAWVSYQPQARLCNGDVSFVETTPDGCLDLEHLKEAIGPSTRAILVNSPSNPTGAVQPPEVVEGLVEIASDEDVWLISDEVYGKLAHGSTSAVSPLEVAASHENIALVDGVSKAYAMTGWRIGWLTGPRELLEACTKVQQHSITHPTLFAQFGAVEALTGDHSATDEMREAFAGRRELVVQGLEELGASFPDPEGAFYVFPTFDGVEDGHAFAETLLEETGVAVVPGEAFGPGGEGHVRMSYAAGEERLEAALEGIAEVVG